jgi:isochorismate pyruvate lyase
MNAAARIKADRAHVRDEDRKAQVLSNVADYAAKHGVPAEVVSGMWELLIEGSIAYELSQWDQNRS